MRLLLVLTTRRCPLTGEHATHKDIKCTWRCAAQGAHVRPVNHRGLHVVVKRISHCQVPPHGHSTHCLGHTEAPGAGEVPSVLVINAVEVAILCQRRQLPHELLGILVESLGIPLGTVDQCPERAALLRWTET